jgi:DNA primase
MSGPVARVLERLDGVRRTRRGALGLCPHHPDTSPSLAVDEGDDGRALLYCRAGCRTSDILRALGLRYADLFPPRTGDAIHSAPRPRMLDDIDHARRDMLAEARR